MSLSYRKIHIPLLPRNIVLRIILMATLAKLFVTILTDISKLQPGSDSPMTASEWAWDIVPPILIILHHTLRLWPRIYWLVICELPVSLIETATTGYYFAPAIANVAYTDSFTNLIPDSVSAFVVAVFSFISFLFLLCDVLRDRWEILRRPYDFSAGLCATNRQWSFICGNSATRKRFSTDKNFIQCVRVALAILCLSVILSLATYSLILQPVGSTGRRFIKTSKVATGGGDMASVLSTLTDVQRNLEWPFQAVLTIQNVSASYQYPIVSLALIEDGDILPLQFTQPDCWNSTVPGAVLINCSLQWYFGRGAISEVLATIHFLEPSGNFQLYLGMTNLTSDILSEAEPISITPGSNIHAWSSISVQERLLNSKAAAFGISQYRRFAVFNIRSPSPDLLPSLPRDNQTATLRANVRWQPDIEVKREYLENSVVNGIATVGGVWTLVNGTFAAIFGSTLLLVLFGIKPLSIYGLVHLFRPGRGSLADGGYKLSPEERDRIVGILREHLLDITESTEGGQNSPSHYIPLDTLPQFNRPHRDVGVQT